MRVPQTWYDKSLLKDEPLLSAFKARRLAAPPTRQCAGKDGDARSNAVVKDLIEMNLLKQVQTWLDLAFKPSQKDFDWWKTIKSEWRQVNVNEEGMLLLFVQFYWTLSHNHENATGILNKVRRKRGYGYNLGSLTLRGDTLVSTDDAFQFKKALPSGLKFQKYPNAKKDVPGYPEREEISSSQTCPPSLDPTSLSETREIQSNSSTLQLPPDPQNTSDLPKPRKRRRTSPDISREKHRRTNEATSDTSKLGDDDNIKSQSQICILSECKGDTLSLSYPLVASPTSESTRFELDETVLSLPSNAPVPKLYDLQRGAEAHPPQGKQKSRSTTKPSVLAPRPKDATQRKQYGTASNPKKRRASSSEGRQRKRREVSVDQEDYVQPNLVKKKGNRFPKAKEGQEGSASITMQHASKKKKDQPLRSKVLSLPQPQLNAATVVPFSQEPSFTSCTPFYPAQRKRQEVPVDQEDSIPVTVPPDLVKKKGGRPPGVEEGQEGSASITMQLAPRTEKDRPLKSKVMSLSQAQLNAGTVVPFSGQNVDMMQETSITSCIPFSTAQSSHAVFGLQEAVELEELSRHDHFHWSMSVLDTDMEEKIIIHSESWLSTQEHDLVEEDFDLDCEAPAATQMDIFPTHKPPLCVNPPIWAQSRQEVCETFDWFRSYQGGVYFAHNAVKGYLLSAFSSKRDRFEHGGRLIISHGGGKSESLHTRKGQTTAQPATDQLAQDKSVRALLDNYRNQRPLALLIDDKYVLFPYDLGVKDMTYVVLGFYTIAHAWAEYQPATNGTGYVVRYKFAFRWCDDQGSPWWLTDKETNLPPPSIPTSLSPKPIPKRKPRKLLNNGGIISEKQGENGEGAVLHTKMVREAVSHESKSSKCRLCHMDSPHVYAWAWLCLHPDCSGFWKDIKGNFPPDNLEYDLDFLKLMASLPVPPDFGKLKPDPPPRLSTDGTVTSYAFTRGFHCNSCGRLSCRFKWEKWECSNCKECLPVSRPAHEAKDFWSNLPNIGYKDHFISKRSKIEQQPVRSFRHENGMGTTQSFILPDGRGMIHHIQPGTPLGRLEADEIFIEYQRQATAGELKFRRWPLRTHKCRGALLTNYFSQNSGEPYQYVGGSANSVPFENAPGAVLKARALIQKRMQQALGMHVEFNEILSAAYMERQKMAFHSDNEIGLGPVVAGLSLGSPALMHFRISAKHDLLRELKGNLLSFVLRHGDILVMDGASVQDYYEHTVIPNNFRIAATARHITPGHA